MCKKLKAILAHTKCSVNVSCYIIKEVLLSVLQMGLREEK